MPITRCEQDVKDGHLYDADEGSLVQYADLLAALGPVSEEEIEGKLDTVCRNARSRFDVSLEDDRLMRMYRIAELDIRRRIVGQEG
jgi:hypothetical protein